MSAIDKKRKGRVATAKNHTDTTTTVVTSTSQGKTTRNAKAKAAAAEAIDAEHEHAPPDGILPSAGVQAKGTTASGNKTARETAFDNLMQEDSLPAATMSKKTAGKGGKRKAVTTAEPTDPEPPVAPPKARIGNGKKSNRVPDSIPLQPDDQEPEPTTPVQSKAGKAKRAPDLTAPPTPNTRLSVRRQGQLETSVIDLKKPAHKPTKPAEKPRHQPAKAPQVKPSAGTSQLRAPDKVTTVHKKQPSSTAQPIKKPKAKAASPVYISDESSSLSEEDSDSREEPAMTEGDNLPDEEDDDDNDEEDEEEEEEEDSDSLDKPLDSLDRAFARDLEELEEDDDYADTEEESVNAMVALPPLSDYDNDEDGLAMVSYTGPRAPRFVSAPPATPVAQEKAKKGVKRPRAPSPGEEAPAQHNLDPIHNRKKRKQADATKLQLLARKQGEVDFFDDPSNDLLEDDAPDTSNHREVQRTRNKNQNPALTDVSGYTPHAKKVFLAGREVYKLSILTENAWPSSEAKTTAITKAYAQGLLKHPDMIKESQTLPDNMNDNVFKMFEKVGASTRGIVKTRARNLVVASYRLSPPAKIQGAAKQQKWVSKKVNRLLNNFAFLCAPWTVGKETHDDVPFTHPAVIDLLAEVVYSKRSPSVIATLRPVPGQAVALIGAALMCALEERKTGIIVDKGVEFGKGYASIYADLLKEWQFMHKEKEVRWKLLSRHITVEAIAKAIQGPEDEDPLAAANARLRHDGRVALFQSNSMDLPDDVLPDDWQEDVWE